MEESMSDTAQPSAVVEGQLDATVSVQRVIDRTVDQVWKAFTSKAGVEALLGAGAMLGGKGEHWRNVDGQHGVLRSYHPLEQIRVSWHADEDAPKTLVDIRMAAAGEGTSLTLDHEHIDPAQEETLREKWTEALDRFAATVS